MRSHKTALFIDLDGTIIDSMAGIANSFYHTMSVMGRVMPNVSIKSLIGPPLVYSLGKVFDNEDELNQAVRVYREYYLTKGVYECSLYENIEEVLIELRERGYRLYVATSKPIKMARPILERYKIDNLFVEIYGAENDSIKGYKEVVLAHALLDSEEAKAHSLMIGDSLWDREGAIKNNVDFAAVLYGFGEKEEVDFPDNYFTASTVKDILNYLPSIK